MRKPSIKPSTLDLTFGKLYCIHFNSELKWEFTNKREAERFALKLNKYLLDKILSANDLLSDLYTVCRRLFFVIGKCDYIQLQNEITTVESAIDKSISLSVYSDNGCSWCFLNIQLAYSNLQSVIKVLLSYSERRKITSDIWILKSKLNHIEFLISDISRFEKNSFTELHREATMIDFAKIG